MKLNEMCVRKKQVRPGIYKALCDGYIRMRAGAYRVPIGTIIVPDVNLLVVKTKRSRVCWQYEPHRNWWFGRIITDEFAIRPNNQYGKISFDDLSLSNNVEVVKYESDGMLWVLQNDAELQIERYYRAIMDAIRVMVA